MEKIGESTNLTSEVLVAIDEFGTQYSLTGKVGEGGQGIVYYTNIPGTLVKLLSPKAEDVAHWSNRLNWLMRQDLESLHLARPRAIIKKPRPGYVMEFMTDMCPISHMMEDDIFLPPQLGAIPAYNKNGGLRRRLLLLNKLAMTLANLHGRGLAFGDLSPANVFISGSEKDNEIWLIDCDNITVTSTAGSGTNHTKLYSAPELIKGTSGINTYTDVWSFAVLAFQLLTLTHPLFGEKVEDGDPDEQQEQALRGELPWVYHPLDKSNTTEKGIPLEYVMTRQLREVFDNCFNKGMQNPEKRPSLMEFAEQLLATYSVLSDCKNNECGSSYIYNSEHKCAFCDAVKEADNELLLRHYYFDPEISGLAGAKKEDAWVKSYNINKVINNARPTPLYSAPGGVTFFSDAESCCILELTDRGLVITPTGKQRVTIWQGKKSAAISKKINLPAKNRGSKTYTLCIGDFDHSHQGWQFSW